MLKNSVLINTSYSAELVNNDQIDCSYPKINIAEIITLSDLIENWLSHSKTTIKQSTYAKYVFLYEKHIKEYIGNYTLEELENEIFDNFTYHLCVKGNIKNNSSLSPSTVTNILSVIKSSLNYGYKYNCIKQRLIVNNPKVKNKKIDTLSSYERDILVNRIKEIKKPFAIGILLSLYMGLRIGEVCALKWSDVDMNSKTIAINKTISRVLDVNTHKSSIIISNPKSESSNRVIPIPDFLYDYLLKIDRKDKCYVLTNTNKYLEPRTYYKKYKSLLNKLNIGKYNYHALRHTFATEAIDSSFDVKTLSEILGHSSIELTLKKYVHPTIEMKRKQMNLIPSPFQKQEK